MCENTSCEFPFGYEDLTFVKENVGISQDEEVLSIHSKMSHMSPPSSILSTAAWSEIEKLHRVYDSEDDGRSLDGLNIKDVERRKQIRKENEDILKHIEHIKDLNMQLMVHLDVEKVDVQLKNEKWIQKLKSLQEISGVQLLKPEEVGLLKKEEPILGLGELKIDIDPGNNQNMSSIKIEICNREDVNGKDSQPAPDSGP